jgi:hypothetical protein
VSDFAPLRLEDAQKFSCCFPYRDYQICIYAGGHHALYWGYIIYDRNGDRVSWSTLPESCLDVDDGRRYCEQVIDAWTRPLDYEEVSMWRDICEFLHYEWGRDPCPSHYIIRRNKDLKKEQQFPWLIDYDRHRRQLLWDSYKIQLITWEKIKKYGGWRLKGNWEDKIDFLEQVYVLGRDPDSLPRPWLDKWERKQQQAKEKQRAREKEQLIEGISRFLNYIFRYLEQIEKRVSRGDFQPEEDEILKWNLERIARESRRVRKAILDLGRI